jgi:hypothetical protein
MTDLFTNYSSSGMNQLYPKKSRDGQAEWTYFNELRIPDNIIADIFYLL